MQMYNGGASVKDIRTSIDQKYAGSMTRTPTPMPSGGGNDQH